MRPQHRKTLLVIQLILRVSVLQISGATPLLAKELHAVAMITIVSHLEYFFCVVMTCSYTRLVRRLLTIWILGTQQLAEELCAPVYSSSSLLGPSVTSAIASRTSIFASAVATRDAANPKTWPACGVCTPTIQVFAIWQFF